MRIHVIALCDEGWANARAEQAFGEIETCTGDWEENCWRLRDHLSQFFSSGKVRVRREPEPVSGYQAVMATITYPTFQIQHTMCWDAD